MIQTKNHVIIISAVAIIGSLLYFYFDPSFSHYFPPCPFYSITGLFCPGCGSQRAFHDLLHGDVKQSAGHNLLFVMFAPLVMFAAIAAVNNIFSSKKIAQVIFNSALFARIVLVTVLIFWVARNVPVHPFNLLAP